MAERPAGGFTTLWRAVPRLVLLLALWPFSRTAAIEDPVQSARRFVEAAAQAPQGAGLVVDRAEAMRALEAADERLALAVSLFLERPADTESTFARVTALSDTPYLDTRAAADLVRLIGERKLGLAPEAAGVDPLVLARALEFAVSEPGARGQASTLLTALSGFALPDGSFGFADNEGDAMLTAEVVRALSRLSEPGGAELLIRARQWLVASAAAHATEWPSADVALSILALGGAAPELEQALTESLLARQDAAGGFDGGDLRATALAAQALARGLPNLKLEVPLATNDAPATGTSYTVPLRVRNTGSMTSGPTVIALRVVDGAGTLVLESTTPVASLPPGASTEVQVPLGIQGTVGPRVATFVANPDLAFAEGTVEDNVAVVRFRVAQAPDLVIADADISASPLPPALYEGLSVTVRVRNTGDATARNVHVQLFQGTPGAGGTLVTEAFLNAVAAGVPRTVSARVIPTTLDPIQLVARVDPENAIAEADESNNTGTLSVTPVEPAAFQVDLASTLSGTPDTIVQGETLNVRYGVTANVRRYGGAYPYVPSWPFQRMTATVYRDDPAGPALVTRQSFAAATSAGAVAAINTNGLSGALTYRVVADEADAVRETDEANNSVTKTVTVTVPDLPELWVQRNDIWMDPRVPAPNQAYVLHVRVHNTGLQPASDVRVDANVGRLATQTIPSIQAGEVVELQFPMVAPTQLAGATVRIDPLQVIQEGTKANNSVWWQFQAARAVLEVVQTSIDPALPTTGTTAIVNVDYRNIGTQAGSQVVAAVVVPNSTPLKVLGTLTIPSCPAPGESASAAISVPTTGMIGNVALAMNLTSNGYTSSTPFTLRVGNPDFAVSSSAITVTPSRPAAGETVQAHVVVNNLGNADGTASVHVHRGYPEGNDLAATATVSVVAGGSTAVDLPVQISAAPPFVLSVVVDEENAVPEPNEGNNTAIRDVVDTSGQLIVAFDETRPHYYTASTNPAIWVAGGFAQWAKDLEARGYTVTTLNPNPAGLTASALRDVSVLVNGVPMQDYEPAETEAIRQFMAGGGGYLFIGEWAAGGAWEPVQDRALAPFGWVPAHKSMGIGGAACSTARVMTRDAGYLLDHPALAGIDGILGNGVGLLASGPEGFQTLVRASAMDAIPYGTVVGANTIGKGRMLVVLDSQFFDSDFDSNALCGSPFPYYASQNRRFAWQIVDWLATPGGARDYLPDLVFVPEQIAGPKTAVAGEQVSYSAVVRNVGGALAAADAVKVRWYLDSGAGRRVVGDSELGDLTVDEGKTASLALDTTRLYGDMALVAVLDPDNEIPEFDELRNEVSLRLHVDAATDLRVDPHDVTPLAGPTPQLRIRVHNIGYRDVPAGMLMDVRDEVDGAFTAVLAPELPLIPARSSVAVTIPWHADLSQHHLVHVTVDPERRLLDPAPEDNVTVADLRPPSISLTAPADGSLWGGSKTIRWSSSSVRTGVLQHYVEIAPEGGGFTEIARTAGTSSNLDTTRYANGPYRIRVVASDGVQSSTAEARIAIDNRAAIRGFGATASATFSAPPAGGDGTLLVPVGDRIAAASMLVDATGTARTIIGPSVYDYDGPRLIELAGRLHFISVNSTGELCDQRSDDGGATWNAALRLSPAGARVVDRAVSANAYGTHVAYKTNDGALRYMVLSPQGWSESTTVATAVSSISLRATDAGLALVNASQYRNELYLAKPDGTDWTHTTFPLAAQDAYLTASGLHVAYVSGTQLFYAEAPAGSDYSQLASFGSPLAIDSALSYSLTFDASGPMVAYSQYVSGTYYAYFQRCDPGSDCTRRESWLPEPILVSTAPMTSAGARWVGLINTGSGMRVVWSDMNAGTTTVVFGTERGKRWGPQFEGGLGGFSEIAWRVLSGSLSAAGRSAGGMVFARNPALTPSEVSVSVGARIVHAAAGALDTPASLADITDAINDWLATHVDADDGTVDGKIAVPVHASGAGVGQIVLRNLEVRTVPLSSVVAFAVPRVFSPIASPGVLDSSILSTTTADPVTLLDVRGKAVRTLLPSASGDRFAASFDGRDDVATPLPSGRYFFGPAAAPGWVEIDDLPPTATLSSSGEGAYGGVINVVGRATDADFAGTAGNFAGYALEYSTDGSTYTSIARGSAPVDGILGRWDTRQVSAEAATLRLTVADRAGNVSVATLPVSLSPLAPAAPIITAPTVAGTPFDSLTDTVTIAGTAEAGSTVTVYCNGEPVGTVACTGRFTLGAVPLPAGISEITASATRAGVTGPRALPIRVARYDLRVALEAPAELTAGASGNVRVRVTRTSVGTGPVTIRLSARDAAGAPATLSFSPDQQTLDLVAGQDAFEGVVRADVVPGVYVVGADVVSGGLVAAHAEARITVVPVLQLAAQVATDRAVYDPLQAVAITGRVVNRGASDAIGLMVNYVVIPPSGVPVVIGPAPLQALASGEVVSAAHLYGAMPLAEGTYLVDLEVTDAVGAVLTTASTSFDVKAQGGAQGLAGSLVVTPETYAPGDVLAAHLVVANRGLERAAVVGIALLSADTSVLVAQVEGQRTLPGQGAIEETLSVSTQGADRGDLVAVLLADGHALAAQQVTLKPDTTPPTIRIEGVSEGAVVASAVTLVVTVEDESAFTADVRLDDAPFVSGTAVSAEGMHHLTVAAEDVYRNASGAELRFTIDSTPPKLEVSGVEDGGIYFTSVAPTFSATDANLETVSATLDGAPFESGALVSTAGEHALAVVASDKAGNSTTEEVRFRISLQHLALDVAPDEVPRVLVAVDGECGCERDHDEDGPDEHGDGHHRHDDRDSAAPVLVGALRAAGMRVELACGDHEFLERLRTFQHRVIVLYGADPDEHEHLAELREAVWAGTGLVYVDGSGEDDANPVLAPALGWRSGREVRHLGVVTMPASALGPARSVPVEGRGLAQRLDEAAAAGLTATQQVVVSTHSYGRGRVVSLTLDPELTQTTAMAEVLVDSVRLAATGEPVRLVAGGAVAARLRVTLDCSDPVSCRLVAFATPESAILEAAEAITLDPPTWDFSAMPGDVVERRLLLAPQSGASTSLEAALSCTTFGRALPEVTATLALGSAPLAGDLLRDAIVSVQALGGRGHSERSSVLRHLSEVDPNPTSRHSAERSIEHALHAIEGLLRMERTDIGEARAAVDDLLRSLEIASTQLP